MQKILRINELDNVAVVLESGNVLGESGAQPGTQVSAQPGTQVSAQPGAQSDKEIIPAGHKVALQFIPAGAKVIKYGNPIGTAKYDILTGDWVHTHNMRTNLAGKLEYRYEPDKVTERFDAKRYEALVRDAHFMGFVRRDADGNKIGVGTRNEIWIIPTVGCVNHIAEKLAQYFNSLITDSLAQSSEGCTPNVFGSIDCFVAMTHPYGCSQMGDDQENTAKIIAQLAAHPNCGGCLLLSLGCENNNLEHMSRYLSFDCTSSSSTLTADEQNGSSSKNHESNVAGSKAFAKDDLTASTSNPMASAFPRIRTLVCQEVEDEFEEAKKLIYELVGIAALDRRDACPLSDLTVGLKCGGSDGFSGITANALVGRISDIIVADGGNTILTEVPEMFGAEHLLMNRARNREVFDKIVALINDFKEYYECNSMVIYENPSPGNKAGGITTLEDKSLGCIQKSGCSPVCGVIRYGEKLSERGLNLLEGPGNDMVAVTALASAGANLILFTTGRGTPLSSPVPTMKISSNSMLAGKKSNWIDFDAGRIVSDGTDNADGCTLEIQKELLENVIEVASGRKVRSESEGYHGMTIFKQGVTL